MDSVNWESRFLSKLCLTRNITLLRFGHWPELDRLHFENKSFVTGKGFRMPPLEFGLDYKRNSIKQIETFHSDTLNTWPVHGHINYWIMGDKWIELAQSFLYMRIAYKVPFTSLSKLFQNLPRAWQFKSRKWPRVVVSIILKDDRNRAVVQSTNCRLKL